MCSAELELQDAAMMSTRWELHDIVAYPRGMHIFIEGNAVPPRFT